MAHELCIMRKHGSTRATRWFQERIEFLITNKTGEWDIRDVIYFPIVDGDVVWRTGMGQHYYAISNKWIEDAILPPQPR